MNVQVTSASSGVKPIGDTAGERDLVLNALRVASTEARLVANQIETIGASLRQKAISCNDALIWAREEGVLHLIKLGPSELKGERHWRSPSWDKAREEYRANRRST